MQPARFWPSLCALAALTVQPSTGRSAEADRYLPDDTEAVVCIDVRQFLDAAVIKKHALEPIKTTLKQGADVQKLLAAAGFDVLKDLTSLTLATSGNVTAPQVLAVAHGHFDLDRIHAALDAVVAQDQTITLKIHQESGRRIYEARSKETAAPVFVSFLDRDTMVASPINELVREAVAKSAGKRESRLNQDLRALLARVDGKQTIWLAALATTTLKKGLAQTPQAEILSSKLTFLTGSVSFTDGVQAAIYIHTSDPRAADSISKLLDGVKGVLALAAQNNEQFAALLSDALDAFKITSEKDTVIISGKVSEEVISKGLEKSKQ